MGHAGFRTSSRHELGPVQKQVTPPPIKLDENGLNPSCWFSQTFLSGRVASDGSLTELNMVSVLTAATSINISLLLCSAGTKTFLPQRSRRVKDRSSEG